MAQFVDEIKQELKIIGEDLANLSQVTSIINLIEKVKGVANKFETAYPTEAADIEKVVEDSPITPVVEADVTKVEEAVEAPVTPSVEEPKEVPSTPVTPPLTPEAGLAGATTTEATGTTTPSTA